MGTPDSILMQGLGRGLDSAPNGMVADENKLQRHRKALLSRLG